MGIKKKYEEKDDVHAQHENYMARCAAYFFFFFNKGKGTINFFRSLFLPLCQVAAQKLEAT